MMSENTTIDASAVGPEPRTRKVRGFIRRLALNRRSLSLVDQAVVSVTNMGTSVIVGRTCAKEQLGLYASGLSLILLLIAIQAALITVPYTISNPRIPKLEHPLYKGSTILQQICLVFIGMLIFLLFGVFGSFHSSHELKSIFLTLAVVSGVVCFRDFVRRISYADLRFGFALLTDCVLAVLQLTAVSLLAWSHQLSARTALLATGFAAICGGAMWLVFNWSTISFSWNHALHGFRVNWTLGRWLFSSSVLWSLSVDQYPWVITTLSAPTEAAVWASCFGVMAFLNPIVLALNNDVAPRVSHDYARLGLSGLSRSVFRSAGIAAILTSPILAGLLLFGSRLVRLMYGAKYAGNGFIVSALAVGVWFFAIGLAFPYGMLSLKRPGVDFAINVACFASFLAVGIWLIHAHGVYGAACSFLFVESVALALRILAFRRVIATAARHQLASLRTGAPA
jgi:O-antigen/teichoic acid export membrane protein